MQQWPKRVTACEKRWIARESMDDKRFEHRSDVLVHHEIGDVI
jgi:hypothetical protein